MDQTASVIETDISHAVRARRWSDLSRVVSRVVYLFGAPLSAWALAGWVLGADYSFGRSLQLAGLIWLALFPILLFGLNFATLSLRPLLALAFVGLGAAPAIWGWNRYLLSMENEVLQSVLFSGAYTVLFAAPFLATFARAAPLAPAERAMARAAPPMRTPLALAREMFSVWPGMRRSMVSAALGGALHYAAAAPAAIAWLVTPPVVFLLLSLAPLFLLTHGPGEIAAQVAVVVGALWLFSVAQTLLRVGARWLSRAAFDDQVKRDQRAPILFLRSFQDDQVRLRDPSWLVRMLRAIFTLGLGRRRLDHILVERFSRYGPPLALGSPGEKDLPFGAARVYVTHDTWQAKVAEVAERAASVILVADKTPGVEWEIRTFMDGPWRSKTLFVCAPRSADVRANPILAERLAAAGLEAGGRPVLAAWWDSDGRLHALRAQAPLGPDAFVVALQAFFRRDKT